MFIEIRSWSCDFLTVLDPLTAKSGFHVKFWSFRIIEVPKMAEQKLSGADKEGTSDKLKPQTLNINHQDSIFGNAFGSRSYYVIHPEWISEAGSDPTPNPLHRPPWPWEQPRYRINMQAPITYQSPAEGEVVPVDKKKEREKEEDRFLQGELPPISYQLQYMYKSTHPQYVVKY